MYESTVMQGDTIFTTTAYEPSHKDTIDAPSSSAHRSSSSSLLLVLLYLFGRKIHIHVHEIMGH